MTISLIQRKGQSDVAQGATTAVIPLTTVAAGKFLVVAAGALAAKKIASIVDDVGNSYSADVGFDDGTRAVSFGSCQVVTPITSANTVTITWSSATTQVTGCWLLEVSGLATSGTVFDRSATGSGTGTPALTSNTNALSQAEEIRFGLFRTSGDSGWTNGATYTDTGTPIIAARNMLEYKIITDASPDFADGTFGTSVTWVGLIATYKGFTSGGVPTASDTPIFRIGHGSAW